MDGVSGLFEYLELHAVIAMIHEDVSAEDSYVFSDVLWVALGNPFRQITGLFVSDGQRLARFVVWRPPVTFFIRNDAPDKRLVPFCDDCFTDIIAILLVTEVPKLNRFSYLFMCCVDGMAKGTGVDR